LGQPSILASGVGYDGARKADEAMIEWLMLGAMFAQAPADWQRTGEEAFRKANFGESVAAFDKVIAALPGQAPHHWQRGISLYYAGRFADCRAQFALHRTVNPEDFENAAWHMLCAARLEGFAAAQRNLIPIREDGRVPMRELHALWKGEGTAEQVLAAASGRSGQFYAHLYLALFEETRGKREASRAYARKAAELAPQDYMGDVARIHWQMLSTKKLP
jgi:lipoprotein NlpI